MADPTIQTYDEEYNIVLKGYDVAIVPSDQGPGFYYVTLYEQGDDVFKEDVPMPEPQPGETEEESIQNLAQAAIDLFEASRGTLGEGAGAEMTAKKRIKACGLNYGHEDWFMGFKGTPYEDTAYNLLKNYYALELEQTGQDDVLLELYDQEKELEHELKMLDLERMKSVPPNTQIIVIQGKKAYFGEAEMYREFMLKFKGDPLESKVVQALNKLLDVKQQIRTHEEGQESFWDQFADLERQMEALSEEALQANVLDKIPTEGIEAFPNMAGQVAELMEGVELDEPLEPMMPNPLQASRRAQMTPPEEPDDTYAQEWQSVEERIVEMGKDHEGLDPAEVTHESFSDGDRVKLKKKLEVPGPMNGVKKIFESGATGYIDSLYDRHGDCYMVTFDNGGLVKVPVDALTKAKKAS